MKILALPLISIIMSAFYYAPWTLGATRANLGLYILAFFWFMGAWIIASIYLFKTFEMRENDTSLSRQYLSGLVIFLLSYVIVWIGLFNGYWLTV